MEITFFQINIDKILVKLVKDIFHDFDKTFDRVFSINRDIVKIYNHKNIRFLN